MSLSDLAAPGPVSTRVLSAQEFDEIQVMYPGMSASRVAMARAVMVDRKTYASVALSHECSPQNVSGAVSIIWKRYKRVLGVRASAVALRSTLSS